MSAPTEVLSTPLDEIPEIRSRLRASFASGRTRDIEYRRGQLAQLAHLINDNRQRLCDALYKDFHRSAQETEIFELFAVTDNLMRARSNVKKWAKPESAPLTFNSLLVRPTIFKEPKGTVLIIGPFNYPIYCNFMPLIGAISAGCAAVVKPSEFTPNITALLTELLPKYLDPDMYAIVNGAIPETKVLLDLQWDHIFFTGSTVVGRIVATAAAQHLTPTTLELGGKNPAIVDKDVDIEGAARKLLWAKNGNSGQTCTAPDYIMVHRDVHAQFIAAMVKAYNQFYPNADTQHDEQTHLVHGGAYKRIVKLLENTKGKIVTGGLERVNESTSYVPITVVDEVKPDDVLMEHEVFGPVFPVMVVDNIEEAVRYTQSRSAPLGCYLYSNNSKSVKYVQENTISGAFIQNDSILQSAFYGLPFGGVGASGHGAQGGKFSFDLFVYHRAGVFAPSFLEKILAVRYPPYTPTKAKLVKMFVTPSIRVPRPGTNGQPWGKLVASFALVVGIVAAYRMKAIPSLN